MQIIGMLGPPECQGQTEQDVRVGKWWWWGGTSGGLRSRSLKIPQPLDEIPLLF